MPKTFEVYQALNFIKNIPFSKEDMNDARKYRGKKATREELLKIRPNTL